MAEYDDEEDMDSMMRGERPYSAETSDSISLPATSPAGFSVSIIAFLISVNQRLSKWTCNFNVHALSRGT